MRTIVRNPKLSQVLNRLAAMAKRYGLDELVGVAEIAERLGVGTSIVHDWRRRHDDFPQPVLRLRMGLIWHWPDVERWASETGRL